MERKSADRSPTIAIGIICLAFFVVGLLTLGQPQRLVFDEAWYVKAALIFVDTGSVVNREHPMLGKEILAVFIRIFGDGWVAVRLAPLLFGTLGLLGFARAQFALTRSPVSTVVFAILLAGNCLYFATARTAILDPFMLGFAGLGFALLVEGLGEETAVGWKIALSGFLLGCSFACKWSVAPVIAVCGLFLIARFRRSPRQALLNGALFGLPAAAIYVATFAPVTVDPEYPVEWLDLVALHKAMVWRLGQLVSVHTYTSAWWSWPFGGGTMWLFDGAPAKIDRALVMMQNPVAVLLTLPAVVFAAFLWARGNRAYGLLLCLFAASLGFWAANNKPVQFLYHYNFAAIFGLMVVAQVMTSCLRHRRKWLVALMACYLAAAALFFPVLSGVSLHGMRPLYVTVLGSRLSIVKANLGKPNPAGRLITLRGMACLNQPTLVPCEDVKKSRE